MPNILIHEHEIKDIDLIVFDKDGTITELYHYWYQMLELRAQRLCAHHNLCFVEYKEKLMSIMGIDFINHRLKPEGPVGLKSRIEVQKVVEKYLNELNLKEVNKKCSLSFQEADELSLPILGQFVKPIRGSVNLIKSFRRNDGRLAIATSDKTSRAEIILKYLHIKEYFDLIVGYDKIVYPKPNPDMLDYITRKLMIVPSKAIMIGDSESDIQMGISAGFKASIAVCSGLTSRGSLERMTEYVIDNIAEIKVQCGGVL